MLQLFTRVRWFSDAMNNLLSLYVSSYIFRDGLIDSLITQFDLFLPSIMFETIAFIRVPRNSDYFLQTHCTEARFMHINRRNCIHD